MQSIIYYTDTENKHFCMTEGYNVLKKKEEKKTKFLQVNLRGRNSSHWKGWVEK